MVSAGPLVVRDLLDRRKHRDQRRRVVLREVRRHDRLCPRTGCRLADGTLITLGGKRIKDVAGLSLLKLFIGSGGTLGIITGAILRLIPAQGPRSTLVAYFPTVQAAADTVVTIGKTLRASMMELMDQTSINAVEDYRSMGLDRSAGAMLIAQSDAPGAACAAEIEFMEVACADGWRQGSLRHE